MAAFPVQDVVDTHVHLFAADSNLFPFAPGAPYRPRSNLEPATLARAMDKAGVSLAVAVQPEPYGADHDYLRWCVDAAPDRLRAVGLVTFPEQDPAEAILSLKRDFGPALAGVRIHLHGAYPDPSSAWLDELGRAAVGNGVFVQLLSAPRRAPTAVARLSSSGVAMVFDHIAQIGGPDDYTILEDLAGVPSTIIKVSELHRGSPPVVVPALRAVAELALQVFGPLRVIVGSGHRGRWSARQYRKVVREYRSMANSLDPAARSAVLRDNALGLVS